MEILPGVLAYNEGDFRKHLLHPELRAVASMFHVDVLDNSLFPFRCWADPSVIGQWKNLPDIELHCMVAQPVRLVQTWKDHVATLKRVIVHFEIGRGLSEAIKQLRALDLEVMVAVNPSTQVDDIARLPIDGLLVMGVEPGKSGQAFLGEPILSKIRRARSLFPNLTLAVDGGVSEATISQISAAGTRRGVASSALWKAENPAEAYKNLLNKTR
jgi:ribulose-phosphate 3-epimerase